MLIIMLMTMVIWWWWGGWQWWWGWGWWWQLWWWKDCEEWDDHPMSIMMMMTMTMMAMMILMMNMSELTTPLSIHSFGQFDDDDDDDNDNDNDGRIVKSELTTHCRYIQLPTNWFCTPLYFNSILLHCITLHCITLHCTALHQNSIKCILMHTSWFWHFASFELFRAAWLRPLCIRHSGHLTQAKVTTLGITFAECQNFAPNIQIRKFSAKLFQKICTFYSSLSRLTTAVAAR